jgi:hypothetical protein
MVEGASPEQEFQYPHQTPVPPPDAATGHSPPTYLYQQPAFSQYAVHDPQFQPFAHPSQLFIAQSHAPDSALSRILSHPNVAVHRDSLVHYLCMTPGLWAELYRPEVPSPAHHLLKQGLVLKYGRLPDDLWMLVNELREQPDFPQLQDHCVSAILSTTPQQNPPQTPSVFTEREVRVLGNPGYGAPFGQPHDSPLLVLPRGEGSQTGATTPLSVAGPSRSKSQSPYQRTRGRAPKGERYKCPYTNCKHEPFRNAGNFTNHMRSAHFESEYRNRHPSEFLMRESSPAPSVSGDGPSSSTTTASGSPLAFRAASQDYFGANLASVMSRETSVSLGYHGVEGIGPDAGSGRSGQEEPQEPVVTRKMATSSLTEEFALEQGRQGVRAINPPDDISEASPTQEGPVGFAEFQMMEQRRRGKGKRK